MKDQPHAHIIQKKMIKTLVAEPANEEILFVHVLPSPPSSQLTRGQMVNPS